MERIFITGVSTGLGRGLAEAYLARGARVYGCSRRRPGDLCAQGLRHLTLDLAAGESGGDALFDFLGEVAALDLVFLNAGKLGEIRDLEDCPLDDLRETMEVNLWANQWIWRVLRRGEGGSRRVAQVVAISSGASVNAFRGWNGYTISKAALNAWTKLIAAECPETHFNAFAPGLIDTSMQDYLTGLPEDARFTALERLRAAKGTGDMPGPREAAERVIGALPSLRQTESGSYQDIRKLPAGAAI